MSPVIASDIAVVVQKVLRTGVLLKKWGCCWWWVSNRSGWLLELKLFISLIHSKDVKIGAAKNIHHYDRKASQKLSKIELCSSIFVYFNVFVKCIYAKHLITKRSYYDTNKYFQQLCLTSKAIE